MSFFQKNLLIFNLQSLQIKTLSTLLFFASFSLNAVSQQSIQLVLYHEFGKPDLIVNSQREIEQLIQQLKEVNVKAVIIKSHTDIAGTSSYNRELSKQRNLIVLQLLQRQLSEGVSFDVSYFGEDSLLSLNGWEQPKNRRTEITVWYVKPDESKEAQLINLLPYIEDVSEQRFEINLDDNVSITAKEGTSIKFPPGTFQNKRNEVAKGFAVLFIKEYYKPGDIALAGMHSISDEGLLQTGGMFKAFIVQNKDTMLTQALKPVQVKMPDINNFSDTMNVFTTNHSDSSLWKDTRQSFRRIMSSWSWPFPYGKLHDFFVDEALPFNRWEVGKKWTEDYYTDNILFFLGGAILRNSDIKPFAKRVNYTITKIDSITLTVSLHEKFRRRGYKKYNLKTFDTTFQVTYSSAVYETLITGLNYINCDRFLNAPEVTDFYVKTPGFEGAQLLVYFKNINAFMPAGYENNKYKIKRVPPGEEVYLIAVGKKGNEFYYAKETFTISKKATATVTMQKIKYSDMKQMFQTLGYKSS